MVPLAWPLFSRESLPPHSLSSAGKCMELMFKINFKIRKKLLSVIDFGKEETKKEIGSANRSWTKVLSVTRWPDSAALNNAANADSTLKISTTVLLFYEPNC